MLDLRRALVLGLISLCSALGLVAAQATTAAAWTTYQRTLPAYSNCAGVASVQENSFGQTKGYAAWLSAKATSSKNVAADGCNVKFRIWYNTPGSTTKIWYLTLKINKSTTSTDAKINYPGIRMSKVEMKLCKINCGTALTYYKP